MTAADANIGDYIKIANYARWLKVIKKYEDGSLFVIHGGTQFTLPSDTVLTGSGGPP